MEEEQTTKKQGFHREPSPKAKPEPRVQAEQVAQREQLVEQPERSPRQAPGQGRSPQPAQARISSKEKNAC
jgi:hypothetical protein